MLEVRKSLLAANSEPADRDFGSRIFPDGWNFSIRKNVSSWATSLEMKLVKSSIHSRKVYLLPEFHAPLAVNPFWHRFCINRLTEKSRRQSESNWSTPLH